MTTTVFYDKFERHAHAQGLKAHATHYCPGCGHGLAHKFIAEAIDELKTQDRTILVSPVGCSVFMYYYIDVGNTQAAHGRAPAVGVGHKLANPESQVICYQGDGDLASIGLAEIFQATQLGLPMTFIFINNAIYAMTGGQLAPTSLIGMKTSTSPWGRDRMAGDPMKMAELIAQLDGPIYVERVALYDAKQRVKAKKAIKKALQLQMENRGLGFVEVLSECPIHLKMTPRQASKWVKENMTPVYPLGVKKDLTVEPWFNSKQQPCFEPDRMLEEIEASQEAPARFSTGFPSHIDGEDISLKLAGAGGDGAQTAAMLIARAAITEKYDATHIPSYGPESRGGTSYADVHVARTEVLSPASPTPHILVAFNAPSLARFGPTVRPGGTIVYDSSVIKEVTGLSQKTRAYGIPFAQIALDLGKAVVKNIVALGALQAATNLFPADSMLTAIREELSHKAALIPLNETAFRRGQEAFRQNYAR